jgi:hypothetical protein
MITAEEYCLRHCETVKCEGYSPPERDYACVIYNEDACRECKNLVSNKNLHIYKIYKIWKKGYLYRSVHNQFYIFTKDKMLINIKDPEGRKTLYNKINNDYSEVLDLFTRNEDINSIILTFILRDPIYLKFI